MQLRHERAAGISGLDDTKDRFMTVRELYALLDAFPDEAEVLVSLFRSDGTIMALPIDGVDEDAGIVHIEISEEEGLIY